MPRILSPNLGCPFIISPEDLQAKGIDIVTAEEDGLGVLSLTTRPSSPGEGEEFALDLQGKEELIEYAPPSAFEADLRNNVSYPDPGERARTHFNNFNENLRRFIRDHSPDFGYRAVPLPRNFDRLH